MGGYTSSFPCVPRAGQEKAHPLIWHKFSVTRRVCKTVTVLALARPSTPTLHSPSYRFGNRHLHRCAQVCEVRLSVVSICVSPGSVTLSTCSEPAGHSHVLFGKCLWSSCSSYDGLLLLFLAQGRVHSCHVWVRTPRRAVRGGRADPPASPGPWSPSLLRSLGRCRLCWFSRLLPVHLVSHHLDRVREVFSYIFFQFHSFSLSSVLCVL